MSVVVVLLLASELHGYVSIILLRVDESVAVHVQLWCVCVGINGATGWAQQLCTNMVIYCGVNPTTQSHHYVTL